MSFDFEEKSAGFQSPVLARGDTLNALVKKRASENVGCNGLLHTFYYGKYKISPLLIFNKLNLSYFSNSSLLFLQANLL